MKFIATLFAFSALALLTPKSYADNLTLTLSSTDSVTLTGVANGTGDVFTYNQTAVPVFDGATLLGLYNLNFTAAYVGVGSFPPGVASELVVTESCVDVLVGLDAVQGNPCSGLSFAYTNANVGDVLGVIGSANIGANVNAYVAGADLGLGIGQGTETFQFGPPPAATPEPGSLSLLGTGVLGMAGIVRRRILAS